MNDTSTAAGARATVPCPFCMKLNRVELARGGPKCGDCGRPLLLDRPIRVSDDDLDRVVGGTEVPVLVDFYADWCGPCKIMAPLFDDLARERRGRLVVAKLNTDQNAKAAARFGIQGIPTLILFRGGAEVARQVGAVPRRQLDELVAAAIGKEN